MSTASLTCVRTKQQKVNSIIKGHWNPLRRKNITPDLRSSRFKSQPCHLVPMKPWLNHMGFFQRSVSTGENWVCGLPRSAVTTHSRQSRESQVKLCKTLHLRKLSVSSIQGFKVKGLQRKTLATAFSQARDQRVESGHK